MNDPIKKFVEQHKEAFDHMEPPAAVLDQIKNRLKAKAEEEKKAGLKKTEERKIIPLFSRAKWAVAASILLAITTTYFFYNNKGNNNISDKVVQQPAKTNKQGNTSENATIQQKEQGKQLDAIGKAAESDNEIAVNKYLEEGQANALGQNITIGKGVNVKQLAESKQEVSKKAIYHPVQLDIATKDLYARLGDSSSSTVRLSAILEIDKINSINKNTLNNLAKTLNHDSNSNVRLAALEVMGQYVNNKHVSSLLVNSFSTQNDPLVQLGLIGLIGKIDNVKVEDRLFALADDPNTLGAVKDEAYLALLNQNKL